MKTPELAGKRPEIGWWGRVAAGMFVGGFRVYKNDERDEMRCFYS